MIRLLLPLLAVTEETGPTDPSNVGIGSVVLTLLAAAFLVWVGYLVISSRRRAKTVEETPANLSPYLSDDELENKRVTRVLNAAVVSAAVLAIALPVYYINEGDRQIAAAEKIHEKDIEEGEKWFTEFSCINCHGPGGVGGAAPFIEARSGLDVAWTAPSINDVFQRFSEDEVRYWIEYGRSGTPMPAGGLEGGGAMSEQEVDQVLEYLWSIQISQGEALDEVEGIVDDAVSRIEGGEATVIRRIAVEEAALADTLDAPDKFAVIDELPAEIRFLMAGDGTCTDASAALVGSSCGTPGQDSDRDGLTDSVEIRLTEIGAIADETLEIRQIVDETDADGAIVLDEDGNRISVVAFVEDGSLPNVYGLELDPNNAFTGTDLTGQPVPDLDRVDAFLRDLDTARLTLSVIDSRLDVFTGSIEDGLAFLRTSLDEQLWEVDYDEIAAEAGLSVAEATRAVGLYNGYCARCHTGGYQAGVPYERPAGSGAWGPALWNGRTTSQFPTAAEHVNFIINGSNVDEAFGVNGLGRGWMPAFGRILSVEDIELIVAYERSL
jgi:mono/diheme cytochrome c family protein